MDPDIAVAIHVLDDVAKLNLHGKVSLTSRSQSSDKRLNEDRDAVHRAYVRGEMVQWWADHLDKMRGGEAATVVKLAQCSAGNNF
jgi:hypothetical protein